MLTLLFSSSSISAIDFVFIFVSEDENEITFFARYAGATGAAGGGGGS